MQKINNLLERFKNLSIPEEAIRNNVSSVIKSELGIDIPMKDILVRGDIARLSCDSSTKSEIFLNKRKVIEKIEGGKIKDIR